MTPAKRNIMRIKSVFSLLGTICLTLAIGRASAAQLIWDPTGNNGGAGSGNWDTNAGNTVWWNGTSDVVWSQTSTNAALNGAIFNGPDAAAGTYAVSIDVGQVAVTNLQITSNGYTFSGAGGIYVGANDVLSVAVGKTVTFNCPMGGSGTSPAWELGSGATMNVGGSLINAQQLRMGGAANSVFNLSGAGSSIAIPYVLAPAVNITGGLFTTSGNFFIGYPSLGYSTGTLTVSGGTVSENGGIFIVGRGNGQGTLIIQSGGTVNIGVSKVEPLAMCYDGAAGDVGTVDVQGGTLQVGTSAFASPIDFFDSGAAASGSTSVLTQEGGAINTWGGIVFGTAGGAAGSSATLTQTGGALNVGPSGITKGGTYTGSLSITLSGGTVGDLASPGWSSLLPMTLGTTGGNVSFNPGNTITLSGALTGAGGLNVTSGTLALTGANNYAGSTAVSNGTLAVATANSPISGGAVTVDGTLGTPTLTVNSTSGDSWSIGSGLTFQNNTTALNFQFGSLPPNPSVAPIQVTGSVAFTATPNVTIGGSGIANGTYPLITYTSGITGTMPTSVTTWQGGSASAGIIFNSGNTIYLQVTASSVTAPLYWSAGNGAWNFASPNWTQSSAPADYSDGDTVIFDNSATGTGPFTVTLNNTTVNPFSVTFNNSSKSYTVTNTGTGSITGSGVLSLLGGGTNTLTGANTYNGGTVLSAGQLNINNGGSGLASAIGTGTLTINGGTVDNTSGSDVTLQPSNPEIWNGNFTYLGSANNFNTGAGGVTLSASIVLDVNAMNFTVGGAIFDNFVGNQVSKTGNGTLTLATDNTFGGPTLEAGQLNLGSGAAAGSVLTINAPGGCKIDNSSGGPLTLSTGSYTWTTGFEFLGSADLDFGTGQVNGNTDPLPVYVQVDTNTLSTEGLLNFGNVSVYKTGNGAWSIGGTAGNSLNLFVSAGQVDLTKFKAQSVNGTKGMNVYAGAIVTDSGVGSNYDYQMHSDTAGSPQTVTLQGGTWDLNGHNENVDIISMTDSGGVPAILRSSASASSNILHLISGYTAQLSGTNCQFEVDAVDGNLSFQGPIAGSGSLVKTGLGVLNLLSNNTYNGSTVIIAGTIALTNSGSINSSPIISIAAGATLDVSAVDPYTLSSSTTLSASGTGPVPLNNAATINDSASGGAVSLGSQPILLTFTPISFNGDTAHPSLYISAGALTLGGNAVTVSNATVTPLGLGAYTVIQVAGGTITGAPSAAATVTGAGLVPGTEAYTSVSGGNVNLVVTPIRRASISPALGSGVHLTLAGTGGTTNGTYRVFTSTNISLPVLHWTQIGSGSFDGSGNFSFGITNTNNTAQFYILEEP